MTHFVVKGKIKEDYVKSAFLDVFLMWKIPINIEEIFVIDHVKYYKQIENHIPLEYRKEFRENYLSDPTSMSMTIGKYDVIIISITTKEELYLKKNKKALVGLIAHELMHIAQRRKGLDTKIRSDAIKAFRKFIPKLRHLEFSKKDVDNAFARIGEAANFNLKDIYTNFALIEHGLGEYSVEDYTNLYKVKTSKKCQPFSFYQKSKTKKEFFKDMTDAIVFQINLMSALIPAIKLSRLGSKKAKKMVKYLDDCFENYIFEVAKEFEELIEYSIKNFKWSSAFRQKYFKIIFEASFNLLRLWNIHSASTKNNS